MNNKQVVPFAFGDNLVRVVERDGEPWFVAKDVCEVLGLENPTESLRNFPDNERGSLSITEGTSPLGGNPNVNIISEPGLYRLIFQSRKPEAEAFKTWVFNEVLPAIRKKGYFAVPQIQERLVRLEAVANALLDEQLPITDSEAKARHKLLMQEQERALRENNLMHLPWHRPVREFVCPFYSRTDMPASVNGMHNIMKEIEYTTQELQRFLLKAKEIMGE